MVQFNPDVQGVAIPDENQATRPISPVEADKSKGLLFAGVGKAISEAGDLYKESVKVKDYTNKQFIESHEAIDMGVERDVATAKAERTNQALTGVDPQSMNIHRFVGPEDEGGMDTTGMPDEITKGFTSKASKMAAARAEQSEDDTYYKMRINTILKDYRSSYPEYRDYIDKVASQHGFGNPANEYLNALRSSNLKLQAAMAEVNPMKELIPSARELVNKGKLPAELFVAAVQGDSKAFTQVQSIITKENFRKATYDQNLSAVVDNEKVGKAAADDVGKATIGTFNTMVANDLKIGTENTGGLGESLARAKALDDESDPNEVRKSGVALQASISRMRLNMNAEGDTEIKVNKLDPVTGQLKPVKMTVKQAMGGNEFNKSIDDALKEYTEIHSAMGFGKFSLANAASQEVQAKEDATKRAMFADPKMSALLTIGKELKDQPEAVRSVVGEVTRDPALLKKLGDNFGTYINNSVSVTRGTVGASKVLENVKPANDPVLNQRLLDDVVRGATNQKYTPEMRKNHIEALFGPNERGINSILPKITDPAKRTLLYERMTDPLMVAEARKQGGDTWKHYYDYVTESFKSSIFGQDIQHIKDVALPPGAKMAYNTETSQFGIVDNRGQPINTTQSIFIDRLNRGIKGVKNVLSEDDPKKVDGMLHVLLDNADKDRGSMVDKMSIAIQRYAKGVNDELKPKFPPVNTP